MSKLEVDKVTPQSGTTLTIGEAGDTTVINGLGTLPATIGTATQVLSVNAGATGLEYGTAATDLSNLNATNLTSGTVPDARFPSVLPAAGAQNLTSLQPAAIVGGTFGAINSANLTNLNATALTSGTLPDARFPATLPAISGANLTNLPGGTNTPAFEANISTRQTIANNTTTKVQCNTEIFDTNGNYDNSSNYRFTPTTAGKYFVYANIGMGSGDNSAFGVGSIYIYKNGSSYFEGRIDNSSNSPNQMFKQINATISMNGSSDFIEIFGKIASSSGTPYFEGNNNYNLGSNFGAYKIIE